MVESFVEVQLECEQSLSQVAMQEHSQLIIITDGDSVPVVGYSTDVACFELLVSLVFQLLCRHLGAIQDLDVTEVSHKGIELVSSADQVWLGMDHKFELQSQS